MGKLPAWLKVLIASVSAWLIVWLVAAGFDALAQRMFEVWGITRYNDIILAPQWIRSLSDNYGCVKSIVQSLALIALALLLGKAFHSSKVKWGDKSYVGFALGVLTSFVSLAALFITGAVRLNAANPSSVASVVFPFAAYACMAFGLGLMFAWLIPSVLHETKLRTDLWIPAAVCTLWSVSAFTPAQFINSALVAAVCVCLYKTWGLGAACLFRLGFYTVLYVVMGAYGGLKGLFETYPAAHDWLSGEYSGPMSGFMLTAMLSVVFIILFRVAAGGNNGRLIADKRN